MTDHLTDIILAALVKADDQDVTFDDYAAAAAKAVREAVPALEWENFDAWTWWAKTTFSVYRISERSGLWTVTVSAVGHHKRTALQSGDEHIVYEIDDLECAKAAAEADSRARIARAAGWEA